MDFFFNFKTAILVAGLLFNLNITSEMTHCVRCMEEFYKKKILKQKKKSFLSKTFIETV